MNRIPSKPLCYPPEHFHPCHVLTVSLVTVRYSIHSLALYCTHSIAPDMYFIHFLRLSAKSISDISDTSLLSNTDLVAFCSDIASSACTHIEFDVVTYFFRADFIGQFSVQWYCFSFFSLLFFLLLFFTFLV
jgi:hypothetical protein